MSEAIDYRTLFDALGPDALVRVWFTQAMATTVGPTPMRDWTALDETVHAADVDPNHPHLLVTLTTGSGDCETGAWRDEAWYRSGWKTDVDDGELATFEGWVAEVTARYIDSPSIALFEPVNEPDAGTCAPGFTGSGCFGHTTCRPGAAQTLATFFGSIGSEIHKLSPGRLVANTGSGWCGWAGHEPATIDASSGLDVIGVHDYGADDDPLPPWVRDVVALGNQFDKQVIVGELGMNGRDRTTGCRSLAERSDLFRRKLDSFYSAGVAGVVLWNYMPDGPRPCDLGILQDDPVLQLLRTRADAPR